jgi:hypothetical protein
VKSDENETGLEKSACHSALVTVFWSWRRDLNPRPSDYKSDALPAELRQPLQTYNYTNRQVNCKENRKIFLGAEVPTSRIFVSAPENTLPPLELSAPTRKLLDVSPDLSRCDTRAEKDRSTPPFTDDLF